MVQNIAVLRLKKSRHIFHKTRRDNRPVKTETNLAPNRGSGNTEEPMPNNQMRNGCLASVKGCQSFPAICMVCQPQSIYKASSEKTGNKVRFNNRVRKKIIIIMTSGCLMLRMVIWIILKQPGTDMETHWWVWGKKIKG